MDLLKYKMLGVINRTPNSFSDHGLSLHPEYFEAQIQSMLSDERVIIDVGFESTAPMNVAISFEEELDRFYSFLEASKKYSFKERFISFDTYKVQNFLIMSEAFLKIHPKAFVIFNDVSGVLDEELKVELIKFRGMNFYYIYTFSHIPERAQTLNHMKFLDEKSDIIEQTAQSFIHAHAWFKSFHMHEQLILDPGFGFSKTYEQNWRLIDSFELLDSKLPFYNTVLVGLSKKSFLKKKLSSQDGFQDEKKLEELHKKCIRHIQKSTTKPLLFRVHDPKIL
jgi:dihydropteroate synthase